MSRGVSSGSLDDCLDAIGHERRREVLAALTDSDPPLRVATLAGGDERCQLALLHNHLPMLADSGFVDWTPDADCVRPGPRFDEVRTLLATLRDHEDDFPWSVA